MPLPSFTAVCIATTPVPSDVECWAVRSAVALGASAIRFPTAAPSPDARATAEALRLPLLEGPAPEGSVSVVENSPSLPCADFLRGLLPPAECNLTSRTMEATFADWRGPKAPEPDDLLLRALRRFRMPDSFEHAIRLIQFAQAGDAARSVESFRFPDASAPSPPEVLLPLLAPGTGVPFSLLDPDGGWRAALPVLREALLPATIATRPNSDNSSLEILVSNRRREPFQAWAHWRVVRTDGMLLDEGGLLSAVPPNTGTTVSSLPLSGILRHYPAHALLVWTTLETDAGEVLSRQCTTLVPPKHLSLADPALAVEVESVPALSAKGTPDWRHDFRVLYPGHDDEAESQRNGGHWFRITLTALAPALWVTLSTPGFSGVHFGRNHFPLESESPVEILVRSARALTAKSLRRALRVESLLDLFS